MRKTAKRWWALGLAAVVACGGSSSGSDAPPRDELSHDPARLAASTAVALEGPENALLAVIPAVQVTDASGAPVAGVEVSFTVTLGGGLVAAPRVLTSAAGLASCGGWTLGAAGEQRLEASVAALPDRVVFNAQATRAAAGLALAAPVQTVAALRVVLAPAPVVQLVAAGGLPVARAGVRVDVAASGGAGWLAGTTSVLTDAAGRATFADLAFAGGAPGPRALTFSATGLAGLGAGPIEVRAGAPAVVIAASTQSQTAAAGRPVLVPPAVQVRDLDANAVESVRVDFAVAAGGGTIAGTPAYTGADGVARLAAWTLGTSGAQTVTATVPAVPSALVTFAASLPPPPASAFDITLRFLSAATTAQSDAFERARSRIQAVVTGDLAPMTLSFTATQTAGCGGVAVQQTVDDLLILVVLGPIDGPSGVLGRAGPCYLRPSGGLPVLGIMEFDTADLAALEADGQLDAVILHEMLHVLGFGSIWNVGARSLLQGEGTNDPWFSGDGARAAFAQFNGGASYLGTPVPVENGGGDGTAGSHWRESVFRTELMTGWISGSTQPLSRTTVTSLADLGYAVDASAATPFSITSSALRAQGTAPERELVDDVLRVPLIQDDPAAPPVP